jgi:hypothetical protein
MELTDTPNTQKPTVWMFLNIRLFDLYAPLSCSKPRRLARYQQTAGGLGIEPGDS